MNIKRLLPALAGLAWLWLAAPHASAWNGTGHRVAADIAYDHLTPQAKAGVDALLARHRDYGLWMREMPAGDTDKGRWAFLKASAWPDDVRKTPENRPSYDRCRPTRKCCLSGNAVYQVGCSHCGDSSPTRPAFFAYPQAKESGFFTKSGTIKYAFNRANLS